jgi:hypothetical protein
VEKRREMESVSMQWDGGIRKCPEDKMAWVAISKFLTAFHLEFNVELLDEVELASAKIDS